MVANQPPCAKRACRCWPATAGMKTGLPRNPSPALPREAFDQQAVTSTAPGRQASGDQSPDTPACPTVAMAAHHAKAAPGALRSPSKHPLGEPIAMQRPAHHPEHQSFLSHRVNHAAGGLYVYDSLRALPAVQAVLLVPVGLTVKLWYYGRGLLAEMLALDFLIASIWFWIRVNTV